MISIRKRGTVKSPGGDGTLDVKEKDVWAKKRRAKTWGHEGSGEFA